jgi:hypothetical protein
MTYFPLFLVLSAIAVLPSLLLRKKFSQRLKDMERDLQTVMRALSQMAEMQARAHKKLTASQEGLEERMMELSVPSHDTGLPVDRRHKVLTLARQGMGLEDIVRRLKAPIGEAELILNLGKLGGSGKLQASENNAQVQRHV